MINWALGTYERSNGGLTWHVAKMVSQGIGLRPGKPICGHGGSMWTALGPDIRWMKVMSLSHRALIEVLRAHGRRENNKHCRNCVRKIEEDISVIDRLSEIVE